MIRSRRKRWIVYALLVGLIAAGGVAGLTVYAANAGQKDNGAAPASDAVVATVDGEPITVPEFELLLLNKTRSDLIGKLVAQGIDVNGKGFWQRRLGDKTPEETAKQQTLRELVRIKVQQIAARDQGLLPDLSYIAFLTQWKEENAERQSKADKGEVVYGPLHYDIYNYYVHRLALMTTDLKKALWSKQSRAEDVSRAYASMVDSRASRAKVVIIDTVYDSIGME